MKIEINSLEELKELAVRLAGALSKLSSRDKGALMCLRGDLGVGKTELTRYVIRNLIGNDALEVSSPTFNIVHVYDSDLCKVWHLDLYRLESEADAYELGIEDAFNSIAIIEWPEIIEGLLPSQRLDITIKFGDTECSREINIISGAELL